jgi:membrane-associated phospholipid phosphatase
MKKLRSLISQNKIFFAVYLAFALIGLGIILYYEKATGFKVLNPYHHLGLNLFFSLFTYLGDGIFCIAVGLIFLLFKQRRVSLLVLSSYALSGLIAQALKYFIIELRPGSYSGLRDYQYFIQDVTLRGSQASFPSGHTTTAFAMAAVLAFWYRDKRIGVVLLLVAVMVGYSRIYTGNHFMIDVLGGSLIGIASAIVCWLALVKKTWLV